MFMRELNHLPAEQVLKTHATATPTLPGDVRTIFLFGNPVTAVVSTKQGRYHQRNFLNCGYTADLSPAIYERDDLGYEAMFDSWSAPHPA